MPVHGAGRGDLYRSDSSPGHRGGGGSPGVKEVPAIMLLQ